MQVQLTTNLMAVELPEWATEIEIIQNCYGGKDFISYSIGRGMESFDLKTFNTELLGVIQGGVIPEELVEQVVGENIVKVFSMHNNKHEILHGMSYMKLENLLTSKGLNLLKTIVIINKAC